MLKTLSLSNFILIESLKMDFSGGLNVITGETGAGKTIIIGALKALFSKTGREVIREGSSSVEICAEFETGTVPVSGERAPFTGKSRTCNYTIRKKISEKGDEAVDLPEGFNFSSVKLDFQSQSEKQVLFKKAEQLAFLDRYACLENDLSGLQTLLKEYRKTDRELKVFLSNSKETSELADYLLFQNNEIGKAGLKQGEDSALIEKRKIAKDREKIKEMSAGLLSGLYDDEKSVLSGLKAALKKLEYLKPADSSLLKVSEKIEEFVETLSELEKEIRELRKKAFTEGMDLEEIEARLFLIEGLKKKHGATIEQILEKREELKKRLDSLDDSGEKAGQIKERMKLQGKAVQELCGKISSKRKKAAKKLAVEIEGHLSKMDMKKARFEISLTAVNSSDPALIPFSGIDECEFFISANVGEKTKPIAKIASGGELSRIMLAINLSCGKQEDEKTYVFDEVDSGISGNTGFVIGGFLKNLSAKSQVVVITHLPQIAVAAGTHFFVEKTVKMNRTYTAVRKLEGREDRIKELARMFGDSYSGTAALAHAEDLIISSADIP